MTAGTKDLFGSKETDRRAVLSGLSAAAALSASACATPAAMSGAPIARTKAGMLRGERVNGVYRFRGVRYGQDTGPRRFLPPEPVRPWDGVVDALAFAARCPQPEAAGHAPFRLLDSWISPETNSEDCLFLNVWTPGLADGKSRPVMVWLHGGGFVVGSGNMPCFDGERLSARNDIVFIALTHRLSAFGYSYLTDVLGSQYADSGNVGTMDQILALQWVRDNAEAFGGDPGKVLAFGQSGGGSKAWFLTGAPAARGLFHRAADHSSSMIGAVAPEAATANTEQLLVALGLNRSNARQLTTLPAADLVSGMIRANPGIYAGITGYAPVHDGRTIPWQMDDPRSLEISSHVPLIIGTTLNETAFLLGAADPSLFNLTWDALPQKLTAGLSARFPWRHAEPSEAAALLAGGRRLLPNATPSELYFAITTEARLRARAIKKAELAAAHGAPVRMFIFEWRTPVEGGKWGAPHAVEVPFVLDTVHLSASMIGDATTEAQALADKMSAAWVAFARTGSPDTAGLPAWPAYDATTRATMIFDKTSKVMQDPYGDFRRLVNQTLPP